VLRELGLTPVLVPATVTRGVARAASLIPRAPFIPPAAEWVEVMSHPAIMDTSKAVEDLGWRPKYTGLEALRDTLRRAT
jgi:nucleoside-diphosphate-sugar epimerase